MGTAAPSETPTSTQQRHDPYAALRSRDFRLLVSGTFLAVVGEQMLGVAIGWELYERTNAALALGLVGLVQVVPVVLLALPAGHLADQMDRRRIAIASTIVLAFCALGLAWLSFTAGSLVLIYLCLLAIGVARAFQSPANAALLAEVVPPEDFGNAATWGSSAWQASAIIGPALGGLVIALRSDASYVYLITAGLLLLTGVLYAFMHPRHKQHSEESMTIRSLFAGMRFIWNTKVILAAISLDMFAVLLGGATALLPIFARDILNVGAAGLGWLRAAPAAGAVTMALVMAYLPPFRHAGRTLLLVVAGFGVGTILFGLSRSFAVSLVLLALLGALDNVSVVIRETLLLTRTPDALRGRVNAVHFVFIGISNELGAFESGIAAAVLGTVGAVVAGGLGTLLVVALIALFFPEMRRLGTITSQTETP